MRKEQKRPAENQSPTGRARLPHEHDQSSDSQEKSSDRGSRSIIKQAHDDIVTGKKDTDLHGTPGLDKSSKSPT